MDPVRNPYAPGAGTPPPELAGRDELRRQVSVAFQRVLAGRAAQSVMLIGLRGVGKTVLLDRMRSDAQAADILTIRIEAPEDRSLPAMLAPQLRTALLALSRVERARDLAQRALRGLAGFATSLKVKYQDIHVGLDLEPEPGLADNGDLETDLQALLETSGRAAAEASTALGLFIDELQYVEKDELAALVTALHRAAQQSLPVMLVGAGLPQLPASLGKAKSYAERLFDFPTVGPLGRNDANRAIRNPALREDADFEDDALERIFEQTRGYPYFLQVWGKESWDVAADSPIMVEDVETATAAAVASLDEGFFRVRFDRLTPAERRYLRAMAELGEGPHRSGDIARTLDRGVQSVAPLRNNLIRKGMVWSPRHGDTAFTVPLFDDYLQRVMPDDDWRA